MNALQALKAACSMAAQKKGVELPDGSSFVFHMTPLTVAERQRAKRQAKSEDAIDFALQLLLNKATDVNGTPLFSAGSISELRNDLPATVVDDLLLVLLGEESTEEEGEERPKPSKGSSKKTAS